MAPTPYENPKTFISYARADAEFTLKLAADLRKAGANVWVDQLDIPAGARWDRAVQKALEECPRVLVILSPDSVSSDNVMDEVHYALDERKALIPALYRDCDIPLRLRRLQRVDVRTGIADLLRAIGIVAAYLKVDTEQTGRQKRGAVFLSYASEDRPVAAKIREALQAAGLEVYSDKDALIPGSTWTSEIERNIHECSLFIPVISAHTLMAGDRFFRAEWRLAVKRASTTDQGFLMPIIIDNTCPDSPGLPPEFRAVQWENMLTGEPSPSFVLRAKDLYRKAKRSISD